MSVQRLYRILLSIPLWCTFAITLCSAMGQQSWAMYPKENTELLDAVAHRCIDSLTSNSNVQALHAITISPHPAAERLQQHVALRVPIPVLLASSPPLADTSALLHVFIGDYAVRYHLYPDDADSLTREVRLWITATETTATGAHQQPTQYVASVRDTIARGDIPFVESRQYSYAQAPVPDSPPSLYTDVVEPLLIISSAIITTILLFTVRSQ